MTLVRAIEFIRNKRQEFDGLAKRLDKVRLECEQFELEQPKWPLLAELKDDLEQYESNYLLYEDFSNELQPLADQVQLIYAVCLFVFLFSQSFFSSLIVSGMGVVSQQNLHVR